MADSSTDQKIAELEQDIARMKDEHQRMLYLLSHDLQAPLRSITGFSELIAVTPSDTMTPEKTAGYLEIICQSAKQMKVMMAALLDYARLGNAELQYEITPMNTVIDAALDELDSGLVDSARITIQPDMPAVMGDRAQLVMLWKIVLENALIYQTEGATPTLELTAHTQDGGVMFSITDNGVGIAPELYERAFELFQRIGSDASREGAGMGLACAKRIVENHGGSIACSAAEQGGLTVSFFLNPTP